MESENITNVDVKLKRFSSVWFEERPTRIICLAIIVVITLWMLNFLVLWLAICEMDARGQFGDQFGMVNALFSGLAFAGIIYSLYLQRKALDDQQTVIEQQTTAIGQQTSALNLQTDQLELQRNDLEMQREEMKLQREEFEQQNFQTTFFNLMKRQQELLLSSQASFTYMKFKSISEVSFVREQGHAVFHHLKREVSIVMEALSFKGFEIWHDDYTAQLGEELRDDYDGDPDFDYSDYEERAKYAHINMRHNISIGTWKEACKMKIVDRGRLAYAIVFQRYNYILSPYFRHLYHILLFYAYRQLCQ
jgi:hypothetical protein